MRTPVLSPIKVAQLVKRNWQKGRWFEAEDSATAPNHRPDIKWFEWVTMPILPKGTPFESTKNPNFWTSVHFIDLDGADANFKSHNHSLNR
jgi:hypothetical protein